MNIVENVDATALNALEVLGERGETELNPDQQATLEFLRRHTQIKDMETYNELVKELEELGTLKEHHIHKLLLVFPVHPDTVRALFEKERVNLDDADIENMLRILDSVR